MTDDPGHDVRGVSILRDPRAGLGLVMGGLIGLSASLVSDGGLDWADLGDMPDTVWVAVITTSALVIQGWLTARREDRIRKDDRRERADDRSAETDRREQERADALSERWRDERKLAHADLLEACSLAMDALRVATNKARMTGVLRYTKEDRKPDRDAADEALERVEKQLEVVHLLASTSATEAAEAMVSTLRGVSLALMGFEFYEDDLEKRNEQLKQAEERRSSVYEVRDAYRQAAREDIGTV